MKFGRQVKEAPVLTIIGSPGLNAIRVADRRDRLEEIQANPDRLYPMEPHEFETVYTRLGYSVYQTKRSHDGGPS